MRDFTEEELRVGRPTMAPADTIAFCLGRLFADRTRATGDEVVPGLTFEELIGALLQAETEKATE